MAEYLDIRNPDGSLTGKIKERKAVHIDGDWHGASHVWIWRVKDGAAEILLQHRAPCKASFPNCYDISSAGHLDAGEDYLTGAKRELFEELGVAAKDEEMEFIGWMYDEVHAEFRGVPYNNFEVDALYIFACDLDEDGFVLRPEEVDQVRWMKMDEIIPRAEAGEFEHCLQFHELQRAIDAINEKLRG